MYQELADVSADELAWLANHQPDGCYRSEYERWREAVEALHRVHEDAVGYALEGSVSGLLALGKEQRAAMLLVEAADRNGVDCPTSGGEPTSANPFVGRWVHKAFSVNTDGSRDTSPRQLTIRADGRLVLRVPRSTFCRDSGFCLVPLVIKGSGEPVSDLSTEFGGVLRSL